MLDLPQVLYSTTRRLYPAFVSYFLFSEGEYDVVSSLSLIDRRCLLRDHFFGEVGIGALWWGDERVRVGGGGSCHFRHPCFDIIRGTPGLSW